jgi:hypothetical protein
MSHYVPSPYDERARAAERAARAEELLGEVRQLRGRLELAGLGIWTLGLEDLEAELERITREQGGTT